MTREKDAWQRISRLLFCTVVVILLGWQLFIPPALGVADTGDFQKLIGRYCLGAKPGTAPVVFGYTSLHWYFAPERCLVWPFRTAAELPLIMAMGLNRLFTSNEVFDLRWMGFVYSLIFITGFLYLQKTPSALPPKTTVAAQVAYILITCTAVYVPLFNSFFFDALTIACLTGMLVSVSRLILEKEVSVPLVVMATVWLAMVAGSKSQHSLLAILCVPALWLRFGRARFPRWWIGAVGTALVLAAATVAIRTTPAYYPGQATFNTLFYRILPSVPDPARYLAETRIPPDWIRYIGKHSFNVGPPVASAEVQERFGHWFGPADLAAFFIRHPTIAWQMLMIDLDEASLDRVLMKTGTLEGRLGNYEREVGKAPHAQSHFFFIWPAIKESIISDRPLVYLGYICTVVALAWVFRPKIPRIEVILAMITAMLILSLLIAMIDGLDSGRHLMVFNFLIDLVTCADVAFVVNRFGRRPAPERELHSDAGAI